MPGVFPGLSFPGSCGPPLWPFAPFNEPAAVCEKLAAETVPEDAWLPSSDIGESNDAEGLANACTALFNEVVDPSLPGCALSEFTPASGVGLPSAPVVNRDKVKDAFASSCESANTWEDDADAGGGVVVDG